VRLGKNMMIVEISVYRKKKFYLGGTAEGRG
jgi:hypothetical protein